MPMLLVVLGLSLAVGVIRVMLSGLLMLAFLLMHFLAGTDAPALDGSFALVVATFLLTVLASMLMDRCDAWLRRRSASHG